MGHMEVNREAEERRKVLRMAKGLNAFVEGKSSFDDGHKLDGKVPAGPADDAPHDTEDAHANIESAHKATFARASYLLRDSLNLRNHGGVCFVDTIIGPQNIAVKQTGGRSLEIESDSDAKDSPRKGRREEGGSDNALPRDRPSEEPRDTKMAEIISSSCSGPHPGSVGVPQTQESFRPPEERSVQSLLKHYPRGKVWIFDGVESSTSEDDDLPSPSTAAFEEQRRRRLSRKQLEKESMRRCFPGGKSST